MHMAKMDAKKAIWWEKWQRRGYWLWLLRTGILWGVALPAWALISGLLSGPGAIGWQDSPLLNGYIFSGIGILFGLLMGHGLWGQLEGDYAYYKCGAEPDDYFTILNLHTDRR